VPSTLARRRPSGIPDGRRSGQALIRELRFRDFDEAMAFVERVAKAAEDHNVAPTCAFSTSIECG
jgi:pterin-4a-carbinolamine dehydratase